MPNIQEQDQKLVYVYVIFKDDTTQSPMERRMRMQPWDEKRAYSQSGTLVSPPSRTMCPSPY
jgi:hypothetical protein